MDINLIKTSLNKLNDDNLISFLLDVTIGDINEVDNFITSKAYGEGSKVYVYSNNIHHVYKCIVPVSTPGSILRNEWEDLLFTASIGGRELLSEGSTNIQIVNKLEITEEVYVATSKVTSVLINDETFDLTTHDIVLTHSLKGRLKSGDYAINGKTISLLGGLALNVNEYLTKEIFKPVA